MNKKLENWTSKAINYKAIKDPLVMNLCKTALNASKEINYLIFPNSCSESESESK